jgi:DNA-binding transcriptional ArsR family regulator
MATKPSAGPASFELMLEFFKALANESRLRILGFLLERPHHVKELAARIQLREPTVCHHLAALVRIGLVEMTPEGNSHFYSVREDQLRRLSRSIFSERSALAHATPDENEWNRRVLGNYLDGDTLKTIPASRKKRWAILKWLAGKFEAGRRYRESEVNKMIQCHYWDSATLRRELIGYRMLGREKAIYWRQSESEWMRA